MNRLIIILELLLGTSIAQAQVAFNGQHSYDGEHKNELAGYVMGGTNVVCGGFGGLEVSYRRHFDDHWHAGVDAQAQFGKQLYSVDVQVDTILSLVGAISFLMVNLYTTNIIVGMQKKP